MRKPLYISLLVILMLISFAVGVRYTQHQAVSDDPGADGRRILHYVDPMNPANTSKEPGIAPCGMPMEPVYAEDIISGGRTGTAVIGAVTINARRQQIIGVQIGEAQRVRENTKIRALGRVIPDENRVYALIAATDGWMGEIHESTTGSNVTKNQLMAKIHIYDYDFYTWQQRYLSELANLGRRTVFLSPLSTDTAQLNKIIENQKKKKAVLKDVGAPIAIPRYSTPEKSRSTTPGGKTIGIPFGATEYPDAKKETGEHQLSSSDEVTPGDVMSSSPHGEADAMPQNNVGMEAPGQPESVSPSPDPAVMSGGRQETQMMPMNHAMQKGETGKGNDEAFPFVREDDVLFASKAHQELLDYGLDEYQLAQLARYGVYNNSIELRSPVDGLVLSRNVTPKQKIDRGDECFRVADLSKVWVEADLYDIESEFIRPGNTAQISLPGGMRYFSAIVTKVLPRFDGPTRTLKVRLEVENPDLLLRPDMFVDAVFTIQMPVATIIPQSAVIDSGNKKIVYLVKEEGLFEPVNIVTAWNFNGNVAVAEGLQPGDKIVVSGNFLVDSESRMKIAAARLMTGMGSMETRQETKITPVQAEMHQGMNMDSSKDTVEVRDPVCGMVVDPEKAVESGLTAESQGKRYYFCSQECLDDFHRHGPQRLNNTNEKENSSAVMSHEGHGDASTTNTMMAPMPDPTRGQGQQGAKIAPAHAEMHEGMHMDSGKDTVDVRDPVCGMTVDPEKAEEEGLFKDFQGQRYYFCSRECLDDFHRHGPRLGNPMNDMSSSGEMAGQEDHHHD